VKLSVKKRFGWTQVRGGRLLRVAKDHAVSTMGLSESVQNPQRPRFQGEKWVRARPGDLVIEILYVKTDKLAGHSYLSGPAAQLNRYLSTPLPGPSTDDISSWFEATTATGRLVEIPHIDDGEDVPAFLSRVLRVLVDAKYSAVDINVFDYVVGFDEDAANAARLFKDMWNGFHAVDGRESQSHFLGAIRGKKAVASVHFSPPVAASAFAATPFQMALVLDACRRAPTATVPVSPF
jgi:hypothetical protein